MKTLFFLKYFVMLAVPAALGMLYVAVTNIREELPTEDRTYLDPLPRNFRGIWWLVNFFSHYFGERLPVEMLEKYNATMRRAGISYLMSAPQFFGLRVTAALFLGLVCWACMQMLENVSWLYILLAAAVGYWIPMQSARDLKKKRERQIIRALPTYLDFLTMAVQTGMNMSGAIQQAVDKGPEGPMRVEFGKLLRDIRAGMPRVEALRAMSERLDINSITTFVSSVIQAEKSGASIGETLRVQADQRRMERFQMAEKMAMEAPVKLLFPLVVFIFPTTFLIIFFPIAMKLKDAL
jgi:tight adherence protein C